MILYILKKKNNNFFNKVNKINFALKKLLLTYKFILTLSKTNLTFKKIIKSFERNL